MPFLTVYTNAQNNDFAKVAEEASLLVANVLHKPVSYVATNIIYNKAMAFGGSSSESGALVELLSIGLLDKDKLVLELTSFLAKELNIQNVQNINIALNNAQASLVASGGHTFG